MAGEHSNIRYTPVIEEEGGDLDPTYPYKCGFISGDLISQELGSVEDKTFYICGPSAMHDFCGRQLEELGVPRRKIRKEAYGVPRHVSECPGWPDGIEELGDGHNAIQRLVEVQECVKCCGPDLDQCSVTARSVDLKSRHAVKTFWAEKAQAELSLLDTPSPHDTGMDGLIYQESSSSG